MSDTALTVTAIVVGVIVCVALVAMFAGKADEVVAKWPGVRLLVRKRKGGINAKDIDGGHGSVKARDLTGTGIDATRIKAGAGVDLQVGTADPPPTSDLRSSEPIPESLSGRPTINARNLEAAGNIDVQIGDRTVTAPAADARDRIDASDFHGKSHRRQTAEPPSEAS